MQKNKTTKTTLLYPQKPSAILDKLYKLVKKNGKIPIHAFISEELAYSAENICTALNFFFEMGWYRIDEEYLRECGDHYEIHISHNEGDKKNEDGYSYWAAIEFHREKMRWKISNIQFGEDECEELGETIENDNFHFVSIFPTPLDMEWSFFRMQKAFKKLGKEMDYSLYLTEDILETSGHEDSLQDFLSGVQKIATLSWDSCDCGIHHWLQVQTHTDSNSDRIHASIKFEPDEERKWKIANIIVHDADLDSNNGIGNSIFGIEEEDSVSDLE